MANSNSTEWKFNAAEWPAIASRIEALKKVDPRGLQEPPRRRVVLDQAGAYIIGQGLSGCASNSSTRPTSRGTPYFLQGQTKMAKFTHPDRRGLCGDVDDPHRRRPGADDAFWRPLPEGGRSQQPQGAHPHQHLPAAQEPPRAGGQNERGGEGAAQEAPRLSAAEPSGQWGLVA